MSELSTMADRVKRTKNFSSVILVPIHQGLRL